MQNFWDSVFGINILLTFLLLLLLCRYLSFPVFSNILNILKTVIQYPVTLSISNIFMVHVFFLKL